MFEAYLEILNEDFTAPLSVPAQSPALWRTRHRWDDYVFTSHLSYHSDETLQFRPGTPGFHPFDVHDGVLSIRPRAIPAGDLDDVRAMLFEKTSKPENVGKVAYSTGMISLHDSWSETYGYFEIRARMPEGLGHWPALWLSPGTKGWPPEIDIIEVKGAKHGPGYDNIYASTAHFDGIDPSGNPIDPQPPEGAIERKNGNKARWYLQREIDAGALAGIDINEDFAVYGLEWTPDEIIWTFGADTENMRETFRMTTPPDLHSPLYFIANTEVGGILGGEPSKSGLSEDALEIDYIKIFARKPEIVLEGTGTITGRDQPEKIMGSDADDIIVPEAGLDVITTGPGADQVHIHRGDGNKIITDMERVDRLVLQGFRHASGAEALAEAVQVGADVWLRNPGNPFNPQTFILRNTHLEDLHPEQIVIRQP